MTAVNMIVYRNCFTGDVSGGDMHMSGLCDWLLSNHPETPLSMVFPHGDGQDLAYPETRRLESLNYYDPLLGRNPALMYWSRAILGTLGVKLPKSINAQNVLVASSHFLPDVLPVFFKGGTRARRAVYIYHIVQDMPRAKGLRNALARAQEKLCFYLIKKGFGSVIVVNQEVADRLAELGFDRQRILMSSCFVNTTPDTIRPYDQRDITLLFCGRTVQQKGIDDFLQTCANLQAVVPNFKAVMVGQGPELDRVKQVIAQQNLAIETPGFVDEAVKFNYLARSKLFVFPSYEEGWGIAIAEALTYGTPVIAYDLPVYHSIFGQAIDTTPINQAKLSEKTMQALRHYETNPATYQAKQEEITTFAQRFSKETVAQQEYDFLTAPMETAV